MTNNYEKKQYDDTEPIYANIHEAFIKLIGYITYILKFDSYKESYREYSDILSTITMWAVNYEKSRDLSLINSNDLFEIYIRIENVQTEYICNNNMKSESEFSDYAVNWMYRLMVLNKNFIEKNFKTN